MGKFILNRFNGQEIYDFHNGTIAAVHNGNEFNLHFSVSCEGKLDNEMFEICPSAELSTKITDLNALNRCQLEVSESYDEDLGDYVTSIYYYEHQDLDNNYINLQLIEENVFKVHWTGTTMDVSYYDGSKPDTEIIIEGAFILTVKE